MNFPFPAFVLALFFLSALTTRADDASPAGSSANATVAVLVEPGLPIQGGIPSISPAQIPTLLQKFGIKAQALSVSQIVDEKKLNPADFPVLVLPYGDTFPAPAAEALRVYHAAGGCLVLTGIAFSRSADKDDKGVWQEGTERTNFYSHDAKGMGTGGLMRSPQGTVQVAHYGFQANPLGLDDSDTPLPFTKGNPLCLKPETLDKSDEVIPLVEIIEDGDSKKSHILSALIRHNCDEFKGARDVWIGTVAEKVEEADAYFATQILVRGTAWCLREKGLLTPEATTAIFDQVAKEGKPVGDPSGLAYHPQPRDTFLPHSNPPARRLQVVDLSKCSTDERKALICLQALTSRKEPSIWLTNHAKDTFWLDYHQQKGYIEGYDLVSDWPSLFSKYSDACKGAVIPDPNLYRGDILAANVACCEDLIVATPELAAKLQLPVKIDLRGRFTTYADGLAWVWKTYKDKLSRDLTEIAPTINPSCAYPMQWHALIFWPCGPVDSQRPGADMLKEKRVAAQILSEMNPNTVMLGFPYGGIGVGLGEGAGVKLASGYAISMICSDNLPNASVTSGIAIKALKQTPQNPAPPLEKDKVYIALAVSDGDNQGTWIDFFRKYFDHPRHGEFPVAFGMGPPIIDLQPARAQWYYDHAGPNTEFFADVSGIGYIQPETYGKNYQDPAAVLGGYLDWTSQYQARLDMKTLRTGGGEDPVLARYAAQVKGMHSIFADMGRYGTHDGITNLTYSLPDGTAIFRAVTSWRYGKDGFLREVHEQVGDVRPAFVNGFLHCWTFDMDGICRIYDQRDPDMVFVTPAQLATLYKEAKAQGLTK